MKTHLMTTKEAAAFLDLKPNTLVKWRQRGEGPPFVRLGANVRYAEADLRAYIEGNRVFPVTLAMPG